MRQLVSSPGSQRIGSKGSHDMRYQQCDHAERKWCTGILLSDLTHLAPEGRVTMPREYMTAKLNQVCGPGEVAAYVLEAMHSLPEEKIDRRENRHVAATNAEPSRAIQERPTRGDPILNV